MKIFCPECGKILADISEEGKFLVKCSECNEEFEGSIDVHIVNVTPTTIFPTGGL